MAAATQEINEKDGVHLATQPEESGLSQEESKGSSIEEKARFFGASPDEILEAEEFAQTLSLEDTKNVSPVMHNREAGSLI